MWWQALERTARVSSCPVTTRTKLLIDDRSYVLASDALMAVVTTRTRLLIDDR